MGDSPAWTLKADHQLRIEVVTYCTCDYCPIAAVGSVLALCCCSANPFDPKSPLKQSAVHKFPPDMFFVLRVVQLLRWAQLWAAFSLLLQSSLYDARQLGVHILMQWSATRKDVHVLATACPVHHSAGLDLSEDIVYALLV